MDNLLRAIDEMIEALKKAKTAVIELTTITVADIGKRATYYQKAKSDTSLKEK